MLQVTYISTMIGEVAMMPILAVSRRNNARDGVTGLLFSNGRRFLQALEGEAAAVERAMKRIAADTRHRGIVVLSRRDITAREFGPWAMAESVLAMDTNAFVARLDTLVAGASPSVRATFDGFARLQRAA